MKCLNQYLTKVSFTVVAMILVFSLQGFSQQVVYTHNGALQNYTVPNGINSLHIECIGAQGGDGQDAFTSPGGHGAKISSDITVTPGEQLIIIVGGTGGDPQSAAHGGGGGGGSFVIRATGNVPLVIAGGGGGGSNDLNSPGQDGQLTTSAGGGGFTPAAIGEGGNTNNLPNSGNGAGGGGWNSDGVSNSWATGGGLQGGAGGISNNPFIDGGFGGGGAAFHGGGGGGGYTGGGGGNWVVGAGGGGSYITGTNQSAIVSNLNGHGMISIEPICTPLSVSPVNFVEVCEGGTVTLNASSNTGGTISWDNGITNGQQFDPPSGTTIYTVTSSSLEDCPHEVTVTEIPGPQLTATSTPTMVCYDKETVTLNGSGADILSWSNGAQDNLPFYPPLGTTIYILTGTDTSTGCSSMESIAVTASMPIISGTTWDEIIGNDGSIDIAVTGGVEPYSIDWDLDGTGDFDDDEDQGNLSGGTYTVMIEDAIGCTSSSIFVVNSQLVFGENVLQGKVRLYPNPVQEYMTVEYPGAFEIIITDTKGTEVVSATSKEQLMINLSHLNRGIYFMQIKSEGKFAYETFIKE